MAAFIYNCGQIPANCDMNKLDECAYQENTNLNPNDNNQTNLTTKAKAATALLINQPVKNNIGDH